jgi:PAS domain S-box-containing protein
VVAVAYYLAARLSLEVAIVGNSVTPIWPPTGIALVGMLVWGRHLWTAVAVAAFAVNAPISPSLWAAALIAAGNSMAPLAASHLLSRAGFRKQIDRLRDALALVFLGALVGMLVSATVGASTLVISGAIPESRFLATWSVWWTGDAMGVLVFAPLFLFIRFKARSAPMPLRRKVHAGLVIAATCAASAVAFHTSLQPLYLVLPFVLWAALEFRQPLSSLTALGVSSIAVWAAVNGAGPFSGEPLAAQMIMLQAFNASVALISLVVAAIVAERGRSREALRIAAAELEERVRLRTAELGDTNKRLTYEINERRRTEGRLRLSKTLLEQAEEVARLGSWEWDIASNVVVWSDEMYRIYGYEPQTFPVSFEKAMEGVEQQDRERIKINVESALQRGLTHELPPIEFRNRNPSGEVRILYGKGKLFFDDNQRPVRMIGTVQDVTEGRRAEKQQQALLAKYESLLAAQSDLGEAVAIVDTTTGRFVFLNRAASEITGFTEAELLALDPATLVAPENLDEMRERAHKRFSGEQIEDRYETRLIRKDGSRVDVEVAAKLIDEGHSLAIYRDITARKLAEQELSEAYEKEREAVRTLQELDELKSDFLATVSHELRTPLTSIQGFATVLRSRWDSLDEDSRLEFTDRIEANSRRLSRRINELLDFSRIEHGSLKVHLEACALEEEVKRTVESLGPLLEDHEIEVDIPEGLVAHADPKAISLVLDNLLTNAAKFSRPGSSIKVGAGALDDQTIVIGVKDSGVGVPSDEKERIFDSFYRVYRGETAGPGTGIGLAIAKSYAEAQGGHIWVESPPSGGSIFRFTLRRPPAPQLVNAELGRSEAS